MAVSVRTDASISESGTTRFTSPPIIENKPADVLFNAGSYSR